MHRSQGCSVSVGGCSREEAEGGARQEEGESSGGSKPARETRARVLEAPSWVIRREGEQYGNTSDGGQGDHAVMGWLVQW